METKQNPLISIIIPTKNEEKCIKKILEQYLPFKKSLGLEIIISDGGSTDHTMAIAKEYADKIVLLKKGERQTIAMGRNAGAKFARGKILVHTDADVVIPDKEKFFGKIIETFKNPQVVAATAKLKIYPEEERINDRIAHFLINSAVWVTSLFFPFLGKGECQIVRASSFSKVGGYGEDLVMGEDSTLFYKLKDLGKIVYFRKLCVYHSPRRFRKQGYIRMLAIFAFEGIYMILSRRSFLQEWKQVR